MIAFLKEGKGKAKAKAIAKFKAKAKTIAKDDNDAIVKSQQTKGGGIQMLQVDSKKLKAVGRNPEDGSLRSKDAH